MTTNKTPGLLLPATDKFGDSPIDNVAECFSRFCIIALLFGGLFTMPAARAAGETAPDKPAPPPNYNFLSDSVPGNTTQTQVASPSPAPAPSPSPAPAAAAAPSPAAPAPATPVQQAGARSAYSEAVKSTAAPLPAAAKAPPPAPAPVSLLAAADAGPRIRVSQVRFTGNSVYTQQQLAALVAPDLNRDLTFAQLTGLAARVENYYRANGYQLTRVVLPKQDLRGGAPLEIQVLEGRLGRVNVIGNKRYSAKRVQDTVTSFVEPGKPFAIPQVERSVILLNQRSGIIAGSMLKPGAQVGYTDIDVDIKESRRITGSIEANNFGTEDIGEFGIIAAAGLPNFLGLGDELNAFATIPLGGSNSWCWQAGYSIPVNVRGTIAQAYIGSGKNRAENEYAVLDIKGDTFSWGAGASHTFVFNARNVLKAQAWFEWQDLEQQMLGATTSQDNIRKLRFGADYDRKDSTGRTLVSTYLHTGLGEIFGGMDDNSVLSSRAYARADDDFAKLTVNAMRVQSFTPRLYALFSLAGQLSFTTLVSGEQIYIGGANTVRGQPASFYYGDDGYILNAEGRFSILPHSPRWQLAAFVDYGQVHVREPIAGQKDWNSLSGAGIGLRAEIIRRLDARLDLGFPLGPRRGDACYVYIQARYSL